MTIDVIHKYYILTRWLIIGLPFTKPFIKEGKHKVKWSIFLRPFCNDITLFTCFGAIIRVL